MTTLCECGYDRAQFIAHHDIAEGARFECPACGRSGQAPLAQREPPVSNASEPLGCEPANG